MSVSKSGNTLTISSTEPFKGSVRITATRNNIPVVSESAKLIAYGDPNLQDLVTGVENADGVSAYLNVETPTGTMALKKTSEDGKVEGITFTVAGNGINQTVTTNATGEIQIDGLTPGVYTVTEQGYEKYEPQSVQRVTVIGGKTTTVTFNNVLKRGELTVTKTSEDSLVEGMKFHLYGTSLSGIAVDEYAVTDSSGKAYFKNVLIGSGYVLEEVDIPVRYVVPDSQTASVEWNTVMEKSVANVLKKWNATVTKSDRETGTPQGNASLAGAVYGVYKGNQLIDTYTTDVDGQFVTAYYVCGDDWSIREISPSEGYLLDETSYHVGAEAQFYTVEYNSTANDVTEQVTKDKAENSISASERNPEEYASDRISGMLMPWFMRQFISLTGMAVKRSKPRRIISTPFGNVWSSAELNSRKEQQRSRRKSGQSSRLQKLFAPSRHIHLRLVQVPCPLIQKSGRK